MARFCWKRAARGQLGLPPGPGGRPRHAIFTPCEDDKTLGEFITHNADEAADIRRQAPFHRGAIYEPRPEVVRDDGLVPADVKTVKAASARLPAFPITADPDRHRGLHLEPEPAPFRT